MASSTDSPSEGATAEEPLRAMLRIEPHPGANCAVLGAGNRGASVRRDEIRRGDRCSCRAEVTVTDDGREERTLVAGNVEEYCICPAFRQNDCIADIQSFRGDALLVSVTVPTRGALRDVIDDLRERDAAVRLERILPLSEDGDDDRTIELDAARITEKQREALETAVEAGYYETPRRADLDDLAAELGVSRSAVSQRLNAAESKLVQEFTGHPD